MFEELITQLLSVLIQILVLAVGTYIIQFIRAKVGEEKLNTYYSYSKMVVTAIEQIFGGGNGADKKQEAMQVLRNLTKGKLSDEQLDKLIEAAVYEMNQVLILNGLKE
ncbi:phage holin [Petroclostridium sp. X23]|jgi:LL-H family phage holin|uniref:phage holin n=1 Tax=Petroclostridium sp. X23 TaxID=3045146 RepID=UPI0024ADF469|nr:phage holin [Petroclostridium sp. X23]WHH58366.1 phage holin [Petroclostridium sp. X23]